MCECVCGCVETILFESYVRGRDKGGWSGEVKKDCIPTQTTLCDLEVDERDENV